MVFTRDQPLSGLNLEPIISNQVHSQITGCSGQLSCDIEFIGSEVQSVNCNCVEDFVGSNVREDFQGTITTPSGIDYSWGANF